jgi:branched-chain amino acid transport system substrate-binding protein
MIGAYVLLRNRILKKEVKKMIRKKASALSVLTVIAGIMLVASLIADYGTPAMAQATLKIGFMANMTGPLGRDYQKLVEASAAVDNQRGGLVIGSQKYKIELIVYDSKNNAETGRAAVERLVFQDKVKFMLGDGTVDAWYPVTEGNKVVSLVYTPSPVCLNPKLKYTFQGSALNTQGPVAWAWLAKTHPDLKTVGGIHTDNIQGHNDVKALEKLFGILGLKYVDAIYYPPETTDFSAMATRMKTANPQVFTCTGGGAVQDSLVVKFLREAGYNGQLFHYRGIVPGQWAKIVNIDVALKGAIFSMNDIDFDPPATPVAKEARDAYIAKYGSWDNPSPVFAVSWYLLKAALENAKSVEPDKVAAVISNGLKFSTHLAPGMMISRPDQNNPRTIDALYGQTMATMEGGKVKVLAKVSREEGFELIKKSGVFGTYK